MPNWCTNSVSLAHEDPEQLRALVDAVNENKFFNHVIPTPKELTETVAGSCGDGYAQELNQFKMQLNLKYFGAKDWYDFQTSRWGTKWDVEPYDKVEFDPQGVTFGFDSAWSPPIGIYEALVEQGFSVTGYYYEPGMGFVGKWEDGVDDCYDYSGTNSKTVVDVIGEELDEMFGISESMAEYEESEKDEVQTWYEDGIEKKGLQPHD